MKIIGIDYGRSKVGLAIAESEVRLSEPLEVVRVASYSDCLVKLVKIIRAHEVERIVVGVSEGKIAEEARKLGKDLGMKLDILCDYKDESLTTHDAQEISKMLGHGPKKRREMEDAFSASIILQSYLDENANL